MGIKRLPRFEDTKDQMQQLAHHGNHNLHLAQAVLTLALDEWLQAGVAVLGNDGGQEEDSANGGTSLFGDGGVSPRGLARLMLMRVETGEGHQLAHVVKVVEGTKFGQQPALSHPSSLPPEGFSYRSTSRRAANLDGTDLLSQAHPLWGARSLASVPVVQQYGISFSRYKWTRPRVRPYFSPSPFDGEGAGG